MRAVIQRVNNATVLIDKSISRNIGKGLLILLGIEDNDNLQDIEWLSAKICKLRIFDDADGVMNLSIQQIDGEIMLISQFTLFASTKKGNRPSYIKSAKPDIAIPLYKSFISQIEKDLEKKITTGEFGAYMQINLTNDGPVTIIINTKNKE